MANLSCPSAEQCFHAARRLAWCSLLPVVGAATGCLDTPPTYTAQQGPPMILGDLVSPPALEVQVVTLNTPPPTFKQLRVPYRSIDAGEPLVAVFWIDLESSQAQADKSDPLFLLPDPLFAPMQPADSRPLDEQEGRAVEFEFDVSQFPGCHTVTMRLAHESTFPPDPARGIYVPGKLPATNQFDIAEVNWWFDVRDQTPAQPSCWRQE